MEIFDYDNVLLLPRKCRVESRSECDASVELGGRSFRIPVVPANMKTVVDEKICLWLAQNGYFYVMHRFDLDNVQFVRDMQRSGRLRLDLAGREEGRLRHGGPAGRRRPGARVRHHRHRARPCRHGEEHDRAPARRSCRASFVIAGNVGTPEAIIDLENWGADATKVGIGPGKVCITRMKTGFGTGGWQLSALKWCARVATKPIIADGGIREHGDIAKSIRFGATMVMIGSMLAGHEESPGPDRRGRRQAVQGVLRQRLGLQQGRVQARRRQAHPRAGQGQAGRHAARDGGRRAELHQLCRRQEADGHPQGQLRHPGRRQRRRTPADVSPAQPVRASISSTAAFSGGRVGHAAQHGEMVQPRRAAKRAPRAGPQACAIRPGQRGRNTSLSSPSVSTLYGEAGSSSWAPGRRQQRGTACGHAPA